MGGETHRLPPVAHDGDPAVAHIMPGRVDLVTPLATT